ncbi:hypothetical protein BO85DRAFT_82045 [Aspergillus piperis CBS 112811]|uniref:Uncharacterized protein n=1 Tax=Aspergillus piperis CBS 112811 TaxID=1448313 RepID=A0A8G1QXB0_9EURO|nr:hypothetical protein BO85DRAFT_82045 [Aspergillus piperis CBS 112811]RAH55277.1 hypothetical protein BO85DRAFT_82045 [Aspergillus piperis CBS 112811]
MWGLFSPQAYSWSDPLVLQLAKRTSSPLTPDQLPRFLALSPTIPLRQKVLDSYFSFILLFLMTIYRRARRSERIYLLPSMYDNLGEMLKRVKWKNSNQKYDQRS